MPFAEIDSNTLYYEDSGGDGTAIIFSHGAFLDHTIWAPQVEALSDYRCITYDERGHGMSECNGSYDYWDMANDAVGLLDTLGIDKAVFVGMSQGGWLTQRAALASPDRVLGAVLTGTSVRLLTDEEAAGYGQLRDGWLAMGPVGDIANAILGVQFGGTDYEGSRYIEKWQGKPPATWTEVWAAILGARDDIVDRMGEISCPVQLIHGTMDQAFPTDFAHEMNDLVADGRGVAIIEGAGHCSSLTNPDQVSKVIGDFVASL